MDAEDILPGATHREPIAHPCDGRVLPVELLIRLGAFAVAGRTPFRKRKGPGVFSEAFSFG
jgi:hypothetical protein